LFQPLNVTSLGNWEPVGLKLAPLNQLQVQHVPLAWRKKRKRRFQKPYTRFVC